jgi:YHS domain-containing protein
MITMTRRTVLSLAATAVFGMGVSKGWAGSENHALNADENGVMLHGYDPVAYFTQDDAVKGDPAITAEHDGVTYHFSSHETRDMFEAEPAKYVPAFGGFCAMGTAMGVKIDTNPELFRVVDNRLFLNVAEAPQQKWLSDVAGHIEQADEKWTEIRDLPAADLNAN